MPEGGIRTLVLVEGASDAAAVGALATRLGLEMGLDTTLHHIQISSAGGITNFSQVLAGFARAHPSARLCGLYDTAVGGERHVRRALTAAATRIAAHQSPESAGFFACVADLEDELIGALGTQAVERVLEEQGELHSFRRFQAMPEHRGLAGSSSAAPIPGHASHSQDPLRKSCLSRSSTSPGCLVRLLALPTTW